MPFDPLAPATPAQANATAWMWSALTFDDDEYIKGGVAQLTQLAEGCADALDLYENDAEATIPDWVFDLAYLVAEYLDFLD